MTDQHQPAAVAPGDTEDIEAIEIEGEIRERHQPIQHLGGSCPTGTCCRCLPGVACDAGTLIKFLDATRTDLARTRAEAAALKAALEEADQALNGDDPLAGLAIASEIVLEALAAPQSEQPQPAAPVARSAEAKVTDHFFVRRGGFEHCAYSRRVESERSYCERPYEEHAGSRPIPTPPDHQAGDEP